MKLNYYLRHRETNKTGSILDVVQHGTVGLLTPRVAGYRSHLSYYISPYDLIDITSKHKLILIDEGNFANLYGSNLFFKNLYLIYLIRPASLKKINQCYFQSQRALDFMLKLVLNKGILPVLFLYHH